MSGDNQQRRLDSIRETSRRLEGLARAYDRLRWMAEQPHSTDAFLDLADTAGKLTLDRLDQLDQLGALLEILARSGEKAGA